MMTTRFQMILIVGITLLLLFILNMIRKRKLELKYALVWLVVLAALLIIAFMPEKLQVIATKLGIYSPINMIFFLGFVFSLTIIFVLTITVSRLSARVRRLAQIVAQMNRYMGEEEGEEKKPIETGQTEPEKSADQNEMNG